MGASKTPDRPWGKPDGCDGNARSDATVDIGALLRKRKAPRGLLVPSSGIGGGGLASSSRQAPAPAFGGGLGGMSENPIYSPDDSLAKAASKLQSLKALQASAPRGLAAGPAKSNLAPVPAPQHCGSPELQGGGQENAMQPPGGKPPEQRLSGEDSGELAALSALQQRRKSLHAGGGSARKRYGSFYLGDDSDLEHTLHEYNQGAPAAASPRMTRAQRRKSMAVGQSQQLEPGFSKAALQEDGEPQQGEAREEGSRRASPPLDKQAIPQPEPAVGALARAPSVAAEVAELSAELCGQLEGCIEDSPEKGPRGDVRSLRDKLLDSWAGKTYYERLLEMSGERGEEAGQQRRSAGAAARPAGGPRAASAASGPSLPSALAPSQKVSAAGASGPPAPAPRALQVPPLGSGASVAARALLTPNSQRRKLNELTTSLQLLKVSSRHRGRTASAAACPPSASAAGEGAGQREATPGPSGGGAAAASVSAPDEERSAVAEAGQAAASQQGSAAAAGTGSKRATRRGASPSASADGSTAALAAASVAGGAASAPGGAAELDQELRAAQAMLQEVLAERDELAGQLRGAEAVLAAERAARLAAEEKLERATQEAARAAQEAQEAAAALRAAELRSKQLAREVADAQASAAVVTAAAACAGGEQEARWAEAERALGSILKAANSGLRAVAAGREEAKAQAEARGENGGAAAAGGRQLRQSGGRQWR